MNIKTTVLLLLVFSVFLLGCQSKDYTGNYAAYNQPQGQQQPYVGGGCGVAPSADYEEPTEALDSAAL